MRTHDNRDLTEMETFYLARIEVLKLELQKALTEVERLKIEVLRRGGLHI